VRKIKSRKAVSPVIATVILVAVAITVSVAVSYWMGGISSQYTKFEKVEIQSGICVKNGTAPDQWWNVTLKMKNTGTATSTLIGAFVNDAEVDAYSTTTPSDTEAVISMSETETIVSGQTIYINLLIDYEAYKSLSSGTTVNIKIHSAGGMDYIKLIELV